MDSLREVEVLPSALAVAEYGVLKYLLYRWSHTDSFCTSQRVMTNKRDKSASRKETNSSTQTKDILQLTSLPMRLQNTTFIALSDKLVWAIALDNSCPGLATFLQAIESNSLSTTQNMSSLAIGSLADE